MKVAFTSALVGSTEGRRRAVFGGTRAPESARVLSPNPLMPTTLRKPPGQRPAFCVSTSSVYSAFPQKWAPVSTPPVATACGVRMKSTSRTMPFLPISSRNPLQLPVSRRRERRSPPHVSGTGTGCAIPVTGATSRSPSAAIHRAILISRPRLTERGWSWSLSAWIPRREVAAGTDVRADSCVGGVAPLGSGREYPDARPRDDARVPVHRRVRQNAASE